MSLTIEQIRLVLVASNGDNIAASIAIDAAIKQEYGRYKPLSVDNHVEKKYPPGTLKNRNKIWTQEQKDEFLDGYLAGKSHDELVHITGRTGHGFSTFLRTLAEKRLYTPPGTQKQRQDIYVPTADWTPWRTGRCHFGYRDNYILAIATGECGLRSGGWRPEYNSQILRRTTETTRDYMAKVAAPRDGFLKMLAEMNRAAGETSGPTESAKLQEEIDVKIAAAFHSQIIQISIHGIMAVDMENPFGE